MRRRGFLAATVGLFAGLRHGKFPAAAPETVVLDAAEAAWPSTIVSAGGLCAPLTPIYDLPVIPFAGPSPLKDALPGFRVERAVVFIDAEAYEDRS